MRIDKSIAVLAALLVASAIQARAQVAPNPGAKPKAPVAGDPALTNEWTIPAPTPVRVHIAKGLWWECFRLTEAVSELGGAALSCSYHSNGRGGSGLRYYPTGLRELAANNLLLVANVSAGAFTPAGLTNLEQFVNAGGGLFVFGGPFAFAAGGYADTSLERLLPFTVTTNRGALKAEHGLVLAPRDESKGVLPRDLAWPLKPVALYYHPSELKPGAMALMNAGDKPVLAVWKYGKGRVATLALSAQGEPEPGELPFWEWSDMPRLVAAVGEWLIAAQPALPGVTQASDETSRRALDALAIMDAGRDETKRAAKLASLSAKCRDRAFALDLAAAVNTLQDTPDRRFVEDVLDAVKPYVDTRFAKEADLLIESGDAGKAALGIRLLGLIKQEGTAARLVRYLNQGMHGVGTEKKRDEGILDGMGGAAEAILDSDDRIKLAAAQATADLGDVACLEALKRATTAFSSKRSQFGETSDANETSEEAYQQSLGSRCVLGDTEAVRPFIAAILRDADLIHQYNNCRDDMLAYTMMKDRQFVRQLTLGTKLVPLILRRQDKCLEMLRRMPYSVAPGLVAALSGAWDPDYVRIANAALVETPVRKLTPEAVGALLPLLTDNELPELRRLVFRQSLTRNNGKLPDEARGVVRSLAASTNAVSAFFALQVAPQLDPKDRVQVISAATQHADPEIRRLAGLSLSLLTDEEKRQVGK